MKHLLKELFKKTFEKEVVKYVENQMYLRLRNNNVICIEPTSSNFCQKCTEFDTLTLKVLNHRGVIHSQEIRLDYILPNFDKSKKDGEDRERYNPKTTCTTRKIIRRKDNYINSFSKYEWEYPLSLEDIEIICKLTKDFVDLWNDFIL